MLKRSIFTASILALRNVNVDQGMVSAFPDLHNSVLINILRHALSEMCVQGRTPSTCVGLHYMYRVFTTVCGTGKYLEGRCFRIWW